MGRTTHQQKRHRFDTTADVCQICARRDSVTIQALRSCPPAFTRAVRRARGMDGTGKRRHARGAIGMTGRSRRCARREVPNGRDGHVSRASRSTRNQAFRGRFCAARRGLVSAESEGISSPKFRRSFAVPRPSRAARAAPVRVRAAVGRMPAHPIVQGRATLANCRAKPSPGRWTGTHGLENRCALPARACRCARPERERAYRKSRAYEIVPEIDSRLGQSGLLDGRSI